MMRNTTRSVTFIASLSAVAMAMLLSFTGCPAEESDEAKKAKSAAAEVAKPVTVPAEKAAEVAAPVAATGTPAAAPTEAAAPAKPEAPAAAAK